MKKGVRNKKSLALVSSEVQEGIREHIDADDLAAAAQTLREGLRAETTVRASDHAKGGRIAYERVPDHAIRITAARLLIEFGDGRAIQRIHQHNTGDTESKTLSPREIFGRLANDGDAMIGMLQAYVDVAKETQAKKVEEVLDVPTLTDLET